MPDRYAKCYLCYLKKGLYAECHYAACLYAECHGAVKTGATYLNFFNLSSAAFSRFFWRKNSNFLEDKKKFGCIFDQKVMENVCPRTIFLCHANFLDLLFLPVIKKIEGGRGKKVFDQFFWTA
jgi:hypothetical protein